MLISELIVFPLRLYHLYGVVQHLQLCRSQPDKRRRRWEGRGVPTRKETLREFCSTVFLLANTAWQQLRMWCADRLQSDTNLWIRRTLGVS